MPTSCHIYEVSASIDPDQIYSRLNNGYTNRRPTSHLNSPLETDVVNLQQTNRGVSFTLRYDIAAPRGHRPSMSQHYRDVKQTPVRITPDHFLVISPKKTGRELKEITEILQITESEYTSFDINQGTIISAASQDSRAELQGWWDNVDNHTDTAGVWGDVDQSSYAADFMNNGDVTYLKYSSKTYNGDVAISANKDSVVFWKASWSHSDMEDYIYQYII